MSPTTTSRGDFDLDAVTNDAGEARREFEEAMNRSRSAIGGDGLEDLADKRDEDDLGGDERLADDERGDAGLRQGDIRADASGEERLDRAVDDPASA